MMYQRLNAAPEKVGAQLRFTKVVHNIPNSDKFFWTERKFKEIS